MKPLQINLDQAREIFKDDGTSYMEAMKLHFGLEVLKPVPNPKPSTCFEDLIGRSGFYSCTFSSVYDSEIESLGSENTFATKEQANAVLALAQLSHHMAIWNGDWVADWKDSGQTKYTVTFFNGKFDIGGYGLHQVFLHFKNRTLAEDFLETFRDLIEQAKPLL